MSADRSVFVTYNTRSLDRERMGNRTHTTPTVKMGVGGEPYFLCQSPVSVVG